MSQSQTSGYDVLVQWTDEELNTLAAALIPDQNIAGLTFAFKHLDLNTTSPAVTNGVHLVFDVTGIVPPVSGTIGFVAQIDARTIGPKRVLGIYVISPVASQVTPNLSPALLNGLAKTAFQNWLSGQPAPLVSINEIDPAAGTDPLTPTDIHVNVIDNLGGSYDCVTLMLNTGGSTGGDPAGVTHYLGTGPTGAVITLSNHLLLARLIQPRLAAAFAAAGMPSATFVDECQLASPVFLPFTSLPVDLLGATFRIDANIYLASLMVIVDDDHLRVLGTLGGSGNGWHINQATFSFPLYIRANGGLLEVEQFPGIVTVDVGFDLWVWLIAGLNFGALGVFLTAAIQYAVNFVIDGVLASFSDVASKLGINSVAIPAIPYGPKGAQFTLQSVLLDDLILEGPVTETPAAAAGLTISGDLYVSHTDTTTLRNGVLVTGSAASVFFSPSAHFIITRRRAHRGLFGAVPSQPVFPATFSWSLEGAAMNGTGTFLSPQLNAQGILEAKTIYFQAEGAHCWIWTESGADLPGYLLSLTMVDGAGHSSTASMALSRVGVVIDDFISSPMKFLDATLGTLAIADGGRIGMLDWKHTLGMVPFAIDRKQELIAAFNQGLTTKPGTEPPPKTGPAGTPAKKN
jgi:hypothetical protein